MLVLSRKKRESLIIGNSVRIKILDIQGNQIRIGIEAPAEITVLREELYNEVASVNLEAVNSSATAAGGLASMFRGRGESGLENR